MPIAGKNASGKKGLIATPEEIEGYLRKGELATWKSSLRAAAGSAKEPKSRKSRTASNPPKPPRPQPAKAQKPPKREKAAPPTKPALRIREADAIDAEAIAALLVDLGYESNTDQVAERLSLLARSGAPPLLAKEGDDVLGCITWHVTPVIHRPYPVGRITMLVVADRARKRGIGQALVEAAEARLAERGCGLVEVTSNVKRTGAHAFYRRLGYERTSYRFAKTIEAL